MILCNLDCLNFSLMIKCSQNTCIVNVLSSTCSHCPQTLPLSFLLVLTLIPPVINPLPKILVKLLYILKEKYKIHFL